MKTTLRALLAGAAMIVGALTTVHAESVNADTQHASTATTRHNTDSRPDWNVDYPSQLGPQGTIPASATTADTQRPRDEPAQTAMH